MHMLRFRLFITVIVLVIGCSMHAAAANDQADKSSELMAEYSKAMGFAQGQVLNASMSSSGLMKVSIDECSFCGAFKNEDTRNRIARASLEWLLSKTGGKTGTVEWYNQSRVKIMTISGSREQSEITSGLPCAIKKQ
jgi:hypothetical protein